MTDRLEPTVRFVQISDTHITANRHPRRGVDAVTALAQAVKHAQNGFHFVVHTGDIVSRPPKVASYRLYRSIIEGVTCPLHHIPGNHDDGTLMASVLSGIGPEYPWSFLCAGIRFVGLDTSSGVLDTSQYDRLSQLLTSDEKTVLFLHHHICPIGDSWLNRFALANTDDFAECLQNSTARVLGIAHGHIHHNAVFEFHGIPVYSAPALSTQFDPYGKFLATTGDAAAFAEYAVYPDGKIERTVHECTTDAKEGAHVSTTRSSMRY